MLEKTFTLLSLLFLGAILHMVLAQDMAHCTRDNFVAFTNSQGKDPCAVTIQYSQLCNQSYVLLQLRPGQDYGAAEPTVCMCSTVHYTLLSVCAQCQGGGVVVWPRYSANCTNVFQNGLPSFPLSSNTDVVIPHWAFTPIMVNGTVNMTAIRADNLPETTISSINTLPTETSRSEAPSQAIISSTTIFSPQSAHSVTTSSMQTMNSAIASFAQTMNSVIASSTQTTSSTSISPTQVTGNEGNRKNSINIGAIIGGVIGGLLGLFIFLIVAFFVYQHWAQKQRTTNNSKKVSGVLPFRLSKPIDPQHSKLLTQGHNEHVDQGTLLLSDIDQSQAIALQNLQGVLQSIEEMGGSEHSEFQLREMMERLVNEMHGFMSPPSYYQN